jgi:hypothetical protein
VTLRSILPAAAAVLVLACSGCANRQNSNANTATLAGPSAHERMVEQRKDDVMRELATCESGGYGPSEKPIYGGRGLYLGRMQFATRTVIIYVQRRDGVSLNPKEAAALAQDYDKAADLAKYMIFDLEEPWHWPLCSRKINLPAQIRAIKAL